MQKAMIFIDFENFNIAKAKYYKRLQKEGKVSRADFPSVDFVELSKAIVNLLPNPHTLVKTFLFAPRPDDFLMQDANREKTYNFLNGLKNLDYLTIIEGTHVSRKVGNLEKDINDQTTYFVQEKGTDVNMAVHLLTKGFLNAYDTAIILSADTDYIPIMDMLNTFGKTICVVGVQGQTLKAFKHHSDQQIILNDKIFQKCKSKRTSKPKK